MKKSLICASFLVGGVLMLLRLPFGFAWLGPLWLVLLLFYWVLMAPQYVNVGVAWLVGFVLDIVYNVTIGEHALALILAVFFLTKIRAKIIQFGLWNWKMFLVIFGFIMFYQFLLFLLQSYVGEYFNFGFALGGAIVGSLVWLPLAPLLFNYQQKLRI
jgi:rod shape-determining protein MreD